MGIKIILNPINKQSHKYFTCSSISIRCARLIILMAHTPKYIKKCSSSSEPSLHIT